MNKTKLAQALITEYQPQVTMQQRAARAPNSTYSSYSPQPTQPNALQALGPMISPLVLTGADSTTNQGPLCISLFGPVLHPSNENGHLMSPQPQQPLTSSHLSNMSPTLRFGSKSPHPHLPTPSSQCPHLSGPKPPPNLQGRHSDTPTLLSAHTDGSMHRKARACGIGVSRAAERPRMVAAREERLEASPKRVTDAVTASTRAACSHTRPGGRACIQVSFIESRYIRNTLIVSFIERRQEMKRERGRERGKREGAGIFLDHMLRCPPISLSLSAPAPSPPFSQGPYKENSISCISTYCERG